LLGIGRLWHPSGQRLWLVLDLHGMYERDDMSTG